MTRFLSDKNILDTIGKDSEAGFRMLLKDYKEAVYWHIRFKKDMPLAAWIFRIATNEAIRQCQRHKKVAFSLDDEAQTEDAGRMIADEYFDYSDLEAIKLQKAIHTLPPKQQLAFNLRYYDEFDYATIARISDTSAASAKANYHTAKEKIIRYMNTHD